MILQAILIVSVLFSPLASAQDVDCPSGWRDASSEGLGCLLFSAETGMNWNEASDFCKASQDGAHLVEILTSEQMDFIMIELQLTEDVVMSKSLLVRYHPTSSIKIVIGPFS